MPSLRLVLLSLQPIRPDFQFRVFPVEVAEGIIDHLSDPGEGTRALQACTLVCRAWYPRARYHLLRVVHIKTRAHLDSIDDFLTARPYLCPIVRTILVEPVAGEGEANPWLLLGTVPLALFPRLPNLRTWAVSNFQRWVYDGPVLAFHRSTLTSLHAGASVERLRVGFLHFVSCSAFKQFVVSLRRLRHLECEHLELRMTSDQEQLAMLKSGSRNRLSLFTMKLGEVNKEAVEVLLALTRTSLEDLHLDLLPHGAVYPGMLASIQLDLAPLERLSALSITIAVESDPEQMKTTFSHYAALLKTIPTSVRAITLAFRNLYFHQLAGSVYIDDAYIESFSMLDDELSRLRLTALTLVVPLAKRNRTRFWIDLLGAFLPQANERLVVEFSFPDGGSLSGHDLQVVALAVSPDSHLLATASSDRSVIIWDMYTQDILHEFITHNSRVCALAFSPDSLRLAFTNQNTSVAICDVVTGNFVASLVTHTGTVNTCAWSPDGGRLVTGGDDSMAYVWDAGTYQQLYSLAGHFESTGITHASFSPKGTWLILDGSQQPCQVWKFGSQSSSIRSQLGFHPILTATAVFDPAGRVVVTAEGHGAAVWDVKTGEQRSALLGHTDIVTSLSFSPEGTRLLSASYDATVRIWDPLTGVCHKILQGHSGAVFKACFSPSGTHIASASEDRTVRLWRECDGACIMSFTEHRSVVRSVAFSFDGAALLSAAADGTVCVRTLCEHITSQDVIHTSAMPELLSTHGSSHHLYDGTGISALD